MTRRRLGRALRAVANVVHRVTLGPVFELASRLEGTACHNCDNEPAPEKGVLQHHLSTIVDTPAEPVDELAHARRIADHMELQRVLARALRAKPQAQETVH